MYDFKGKTVFITGASSGLGEQFARVFHEHGARVILTARRQEKLEALAKTLNNSLVMPMDVVDKDSVYKVFEDLEARGENIDVCINNAGIAAFTKLFEKDSDEAFEQQIQTNLMGVWYVTKAAASHMKRHKIKGSIINIGSVNGDGVPAAGAGGYCSSKAAVMHLTKTLVGELSPHKIRINCIAPGWFKTPMNGEGIDEIIAHIPYGDIADPSDMDGLVLYLASNEASRYMTGACITIDGGVSWGGKVW